MEDCSEFVMFFNLKRKRAHRTKPVTTKKDDGYRLYFHRRRKFARRSKAAFVAPTDDYHVHLGRCILKDSNLNSRALKFESAWGDGEEKHAIERSLASVFEGKDAAALLGCGRLSNYQKIRRINSGAFGAVYRAIDKRTGETVAVKEQLNNGGGSTILTLREIDILNSLPRHQNIVAFREVAAGGGAGVCIVMEHVDLDLRRYVKEAGDAFGANDAKMLMLQLLEGVKHLHDNMVMHRDLKPSNILVSRRGDLKICDFGLSRWMDAECGAYSPHVGTKGYRAPEMEMGMKEYGQVADMWAVGCVMAQMLLGCCGDGMLEEIHTLVCDSEDDIQSDSALRSRLFTSEVVTDTGFDLLRMLLNFDPCTRITAEEALDHAWFGER